MYVFNHSDHSENTAIPTPPARQRKNITIFDLRTAFYFMLRALHKKGQRCASSVCAVVKSLPSTHTEGKIQEALTPNSWFNRKHYD